jgi:predicted metal-dependent hydrolase
VTEPDQNKELTALFQAVHLKHFSSNSRRIDAEFYPYRSLRHTVEWNAGRISAKVSLYFRNAPPHILEIVALILISKVYRRKVDSALRRIYRSYSHDLQKKIPGPSKRSLSRYVPRGKYYNLQEIFDRLNRDFFSGEISPVRTGWSLTRSYRRLGFYDDRRKLLVISRVFDHKKVPEQVIRFLVYHEMLHIIIPERMGRHRRILHSAEFRRREKQFPGFHEIEVWIKRNLPHL